jgi:hypothetical protein
MRDERDITGGRRAGIAALTVAVLALAGCGGDGETRDNTPRPPAQILITAAITQDGISVSPTRFGAGPVALVVTNLTQTAQQVTFESDGRQAGFTQETGPISPSDTGRLQADVPPGDAVIRVAADGIEPAQITVGPERPSAQNELQLP